MSYAPYGIAGTAIGAGLGAITGLIYEITNQNIRDNMPPSASSEIPRWQQYAIKGCSAVTSAALMTYCNYILSNALEGEELHSYNSNSLTMALIMNILELTMGPIVGAITYGFGQCLQSCVSSVTQFGMFSQTREQSRDTELKNITVTPVTASPAATSSLSLGSSAS